ncbi:MAG: helix-turn-helix domain-containing protein [Intestinibacillus sp.]
MMGERLSWLLRALGISGKELAEAVGVDYSTMSKWRRGRRTLKHGSPYAAAIAAFALNTPAERETHVLRDMLREAYPQLGAADEKQLQNALGLWLTVPGLPEGEAARGSGGVFEVPVETCTGIENMFDAQKRFFDLLRELPPGQVVTVTDFCAVDWSRVDRTLIEDGLRNNIESISGGHTTRIVDQLTETYRPWDLMFQWLPMYLQEGVSSYFYRNPKPFPLRQNLFLIKDHAALIMSSTEAAPGQVITSFYREPEYVRLFGTFVDIVMRDAHPMIETMEVARIDVFLDIIDRHMKSARLLYMINRLPTFRNMPSALLEEVLRENGAEDALYDRCMAAWRKSASTRGRCESRQIYDLDAIERAVRQDWIVDYDLSAVAGRPIRIPRALFIRQLAHLYEHMRDEHYTLVVYPFTRLGMEVLPPCNIIVQDDSLVGAWDAERYARRMYSEDFSIVNGFYAYAESVWAHISPVCKEEAWGKRRIGALLAD